LKLASAVTLEDMRDIASKAIINYCNNVLQKAKFPANRRND